LSTRDVARLAGISQAYVVALERARSAVGEPTPTPTVDVVARLAHALGLDPLALFAVSLRSAGRHALLVVDDASQPVINRMRHVAGPAVDTWVTARSAKALDDGGHALQLRSRANKTYETEAIAATLGRELTRLAPVIEGANVGFVFAEMSEAMATLDDPSSVIAFEASWATVVASSAAKVGAHAEWNVCVYEISAIQALPDPVAAAVMLIRTHDTVLAVQRDDVISGQRGMRQIVAQLRPPNESVHGWRSTTARIVAELGLAS
jgi:Helix-turn-helix domain